MSHDTHNEVTHDTRDEVALPDAPAIAGLRFRLYRGEEDYPAMVAVHEGRKARDNIRPRSTLEFIPTTETIGDMYRGFRTLLFAEIDGRVVGYNTATWWTEEDGTRLYLHLEWLLPRWREQGIEGAMLRWIEGYLREADAADGHEADGKAMFGANATSDEREETHLLLRAGYRPAFTLLQMELDEQAIVSPSPLPEGVDLRAATPADYRALWDAQQEAYTGEFTEVAGEDEYREFAANRHNDPALWQVAWDGDRVAGQVRPAVYDGWAEITEVNVSQHWRRRGLARALLTRAIVAVRERGIAAILLHTRADNPHGAPDLYRSVGFRAVKEHVRYRKLMR